MHVPESKSDRELIDAIIRMLANALVENTSVKAMFLGGSLANDRFDQYSDLDLKLIVERASVPAVVDFCLKTLRDHHKIEDMMAINGESAMELILRIEGLSPYSLFDITLYREPFTEQSLDLHGQYKILFDKAGAIAQTRPTDQDVKKVALLKLQGLERMARLFRMQTDKEVRRGRISDAFMYYRRNFNRMADAARALYAPRRLCMNQGRYIEDDIPADLQHEFRSYFFPASTEELLAFDRRITERTLEFVALARHSLEAQSQS
jgi:hypothetical protein